MICSKLQSKLSSNQSSGQNSGQNPNSINLANKDNYNTMIINPEAKLNLKSAFDSIKTETTINKVSPNYVGIGVVSGGSAWISVYAQNYVMGTSYGAVGANGPIMPAMIPLVETPLFPAVASLGADKAISFATQPMGDLFNIKKNDRYQGITKNEVKTDLNFNNLIIE